LHEDPRNSNADHKADYMCPWALELLRTRRSSVCLDFRILIVRFREEFRDKIPRCIPRKGSIPPRRCAGLRSEDCERFLRRGLNNASPVDPGHYAHDMSCPDPRKCERIPWDETSYRSAANPRAVKVKRLLRNRQALEYCQAGNRNAGYIACMKSWSRWKT